MIDFVALERANAALNAFIDFDRSAQISTGPLADLRVGVKANIMVKGLAWSAGCEGFRHRIADRDAAVVQRLRDAGASILGTLNLDEAAFGAACNNPWFGATQNPHHLGYTPGGSSGGCGAAVAAGLCDLALGSDTMGSVRIPAAYCGVFGFKPAHQAISQDGLEPAEPSLDTIGLLARDLDVLERSARLISDFGDQDLMGANGTADGALLDELGGVETDQDTLHILERAANVLGVSQSITIATLLSRVRFAGFIATSRTLAQHLTGVAPDAVSLNLAKLLSYGPRRNDPDWAEDQRILAQTRTDVIQAVADYGYLLLPTTPQSAFLHSETAPANQADFTCLASIAGLPAISIPAGWSQDAMPYGIQIIGQAGQEAGLFRLARRINDALSAYRPPTHFGY